MYGRELKVTLINRADAIAGAATLVMGETIEKIPLEIFAIIIGIRNGDTRLTFPFTILVCSFSRVPSPPIPLPSITPVRNLSTASGSIPE